MRRRLYGGILTGALVAVIVVAVILVVVLTKTDDGKDKQPNNQTQIGQEDNNNNNQNDDTNDDANDNTGDTGNSDEGNADAGENDDNSGSNEDANGNTGAGDDANGDNSDSGEETLAINEKIAALAIEQIGKGYEWGEEGPDNFDASGLIFYCYTQNGISIPRTIKEQCVYGTEVESEDIMPGDVVFFYNDTPGTAQFVGLYVGDGTVIIVSSSKDSVEDMSVTSDYYKQRFVCIRRFWE